MIQSASTNSLKVKKKSCTGACGLGREVWVLCQRSDEVRGGCTLIGAKRLESLGFMTQTTGLSKVMENIASTPDFE